MGIYENAKTLTVQENRTIDILIEGSLIPLKQVDKAIRLIAELKKEFPLIQTEIPGKRSEGPALKKLVEELDLQSTICFRGLIKREEVFSKMKKSKILLHTSFYEGQSTVISEALSCGTHVVCFDVGRITDHQKINVCANETEMLKKLSALLHQSHLDFSTVIPFTMSDTVRAYSKIISGKGIAT